MKKNLVFLTVILIIGASATLLWLSSTNTPDENVIQSDNTATVSNSTTSAPSESITSGVTNQGTVTESTSKYNDGTFSKAISYTVPEDGNNTVTVNITLSNDTVTDVSYSQTGLHGESKEYDERFASAYKSKIVGKNLDNISLSRVGGASLTTNAFTKAITSIKSSAL